MTDATDDRGNVTGSPTAAEALRRHRDATFGDVLPDSTKDERDAGLSDDGGYGGHDGGGQDSAEAVREADLLRDVPPHHV